MCGIFGYIGKSSFQETKPLEGYLADGFIGSMVRGLDSAGFVTIATHSKGDNHVFKKGYSALDFLGMPQTVRTIAAPHMYNGFICHVRAATVGRVNHLNAHPYVFKHIAMVHNGTLIDRTLLDVHGATDSEEIAEHLAKHNDPTKTIGLLHGAFALAWFNFNERRAYFVRNEQRPLFTAVDDSDKRLYFASEGGMLRWIAERNRINLKEIIELPALKLLSVDVDDVSKSSVQEVAPYVPPTVKPAHTRRRAGTTSIETPAILGMEGGNGKYGKQPVIITSPMESNHLPIKINQKVDFTPLTVFLPKTKSRHGTIVGVIDSPSDAWRVVCRKGDIRLLKDQANLQGTVTHILDPESVWPTVYVDSLEVASAQPVKKNVKAHVVIERYRELKENPVLNGALKASPPQKKELAPVINIQEQVEKASKFYNEMVEVDGRKMTRRAFYKITENGCGICYSPIYLQDDTHIIDGMAICEKCHTKLEK